MTAYYPSSNLNVTRAAIDAEKSAGDRLLLKCAAHDLKELYDRLALELKDVDCPAAEEMLMALEEHAAAVMVAAEN